MFSLVHNKKSRQAGFTMMEILLVVVIMAILISVTIFGVQQSRQKTRDSRRIQEIDTLVKAIYLYSAANGVWPGELDTAGEHISANCASDLKNDLIGGGFISAAEISPMESACGDNSDGAYFYGWDSV
ncbi:MAG: type II secretion system protein, partial [Patescibacteria group bacterium]